MKVERINKNRMAVKLSCSNTPQMITRFDKHPLKIVFEIEPKISEVSFYTQAQC